MYSDIRKKGIIAVIFIGIFLLPLLLGGTFFFSEEGEYISRLIEVSSWENKNDPLFHERPFVYTPYYGVMYFLTKSGLGEIVFVVLGAISAGVVVGGIKECIEDQEIAWYAQILFLVSPVCILLFTQGHPLSFFLAALMVIVVLGNRKEIKWGFPIVGVLPFFGYFEGLLGVMVCGIAWTYNNNKEKGEIKIYQVLGLLISLIVWVYPFRGWMTNPVESSVFILFSDLGGVGFGIFHILLAALGAVIIWKNNKKLIIPLVIIAGVSLSLSFFPEGLFFLLPFIILAAAHAVVYVSRMEWSLPTVKQFTHIIIICGILFSTLSYGNELVKNKIDDQVIEGVLWLEGEVEYAQNSQKIGKVITHPSYGKLLQSRGLVPVLDEQTRFVYNLPIKVDIMNQVWYSRNLENTTNALKEGNISYIMITEEMREGKVWSYEEEGLLFILKHDHNFTKVYENEKVVFYEIKE